MMCLGSLRPPRDSPCAGLVFLRESRTLVAPPGSFQRGFAPPAGPPPHLSAVSRHRRLATTIQMYGEEKFPILSAAYIFTVATGRRSDGLCPPGGASVCNCSLDLRPLV